MSDSNKKDRIYGPILPPNLQRKTTPEKEDSDDSDDVFGPCLPPSFSQDPEPKPKILGPTLPENFQPNDYVDPGPVEDSEDDNDDDDDDDDEIVGPLPEGHTDKNHQNTVPRIIGKDTGGPKREKWMLEPGKAMSKVLPTKSVTKFNQKSGKDKPLTEEDKMELKANQEKDKKMSEFIAKYEKSNKRGASLLEKHREEMRKTKHQKTEPAPRREFDREKDLCAPKMDAKLKKSLINEASSKFGSRFSSGKFEKFL